MRNVLVNSTIGSSTLSFDSLSTSVHGVAANASLRAISLAAERYEWPAESDLMLSINAGDDSLIRLRSASIALELLNRTWVESSITTTRVVADGMLTSSVPH